MLNMLGLRLTLNQQVVRSFLPRLSPAKKIPFQTRSTGTETEVLWHQKEFPPVLARAGEFKRLAIVDAARRMSRLASEASPFNLQVVHMDRDGLLWSMRSAALPPGSNLIQIKPRFCTCSSDATRATLMLHTPWPRKRPRPSRPQPTAAGPRPSSAARATPFDASQSTFPHLPHLCGGPRR
jgi:hypothetical protein